MRDDDDDGDICDGHHTRAYTRVPGGLAVHRLCCQCQCPHIAYKCAMHPKCGQMPMESNESKTPPSIDRPPCDVRSSRYLILTVD